MNDLCVEIGYNSINHVGEELCGDHVEAVGQGEDSSVLVLADGLGSGVKANILSILTSRIISTMIAEGLPLEECVKAIAATLPICSVRKVAYSTFTIVQIINNREAEIIQYDNPGVILLRDGKNLEFGKTERTIGGKKIYQSRLPLEQNDAFLLMSDGCIHAGVGERLNFGWQRENIIEFMETMYDAGFTAKTLSTILLDECNRLYGGKPGDDTTVCTVRIRNRCPMSLMIGPPSDPNDVEKMMSLFFSKSGKHIVCGGTTSTLAAGFLGVPVDTKLEYIDPEIPPISHIKGVDLATEGVITINRVLSYAQNYLQDNEKYTQWSYRKDGASLIARMLFEEATDINFFVGRAINPAHQNPNLPINFSIKMRLVDELVDCLGKMGKRVKVSYY